MQNTAKKIALAAVGTFIVGTLAVASVAMAATTQDPGSTNGTQTTANGFFRGPGRSPGMGRFGTPGTSGTPPALTGIRYQILGQITVVSGTNISVKDNSGTTYTVDASKTNVIVNGAKSTTASLTAGDLIMVNGIAKDATTTQITARRIVKGTEKVDLSTLKGKPGRGFRMGMGRGMDGFGPSGQPEQGQNGTSAGTSTQQ